MTDIANMMSVRTINALAAANVSDTLELERITDAQLLRIPNLGRVSLREIRRYAPYLPSAEEDGIGMVLMPRKVGHVMIRLMGHGSKLQVIIDGQCRLQINRVRDPIEITST